MNQRKKLILKFLIAGSLLGIVSFFAYSNLSFKYGKHARDIPVLMYHHLLKDEENFYGDNGAVLSVETFQEHMELLHENGYKTIGLKDLELFVKGEINLPKRSVLITFDDGYKSNYEYAYPILKEYGFNAAIFLISAWNTDEVVSFDPDELQYLSWNEIEKSKDVLEYASHTHDFHRLDDNEEGYLITKSPEDIQHDLTTSMEAIGTVYFAYPYGHYNMETLAILKKLGYKMAFTVKPGRVKPGDSLLELPRYPVFPTTTIEDFKNMIGLP